MGYTRLDHSGIEASWVCIGDMDFGKAFHCVRQRINGRVAATAFLSTTLAAGEAAHLEEPYVPHVVVGAL